MKIEILTLGELKENCYLIIDGNNVVIIDPGIDGEKIDAYLKDKGYLLKAILLTHGHFDHIGGVDYLYEQNHCPIYAHNNDYDLFSGKYNEIDSSLKHCYKINNVKSNILYIYSDFEALNINGIKIDAILTPGHTPGSLTFVLRDYKQIFSGDTILKNDVGRTDMMFGNKLAMEESIKIYKTFIDDCIINPGHGPTTSIKDEKENNRYFK